MFAKIIVYALFITRVAIDICRPLRCDGSQLDSDGVPSGVLVFQPMGMSAKPSELSSATAKVTTLQT
jgi:hypothetical protein